ncbi:hypothetical protein A8709_17355 [Paenibacillus pectinilyticus]|uniref:Uncharacterized protein n=1 Tax=Paenibacillus pectinilyticus TaxID=512399 RepID=A0A1C0ZZB9_9BACL|nr:hypothetical protein [Paenibacillus pectinilyticus]OCT13381.1 hypothetical protein A8709_17355 [Paenibacillus pectinilyticus]
MKKPTVLIFLTSMFVLSCTSHVSANSHDSAPKVITLFENTNFYNSTDGNEVAEGSISPQTVKVTGLEPGWFYKDDPWIRIHTWMGDKWIHPNLAYAGEEIPMNKNVGLTGEEVIYNYPLSHYPTGATINSQTVKVISIIGPWMKIQTWLGEKYMLAQHQIIDNVVENSGVLDLAAITPIYALPFENSQPEGELAPQRVNYMEYANGWFHIQTLSGPKWIHPPLSRPLQTQAINQEISLSNTTTVYQYPNHQAKALGVIAPQTIIPFEESHGWYHVHTTWIGDGWIYPNVELDLYHAPKEMNSLQLKGDWTYSRFERTAGWHGYPLVPKMFTTSTGNELGYGNGYKLGSPISAALSMTNVDENPLRLTEPTQFEIQIFKLETDDSQTLVWSSLTPLLPTEIAGDMVTYTFALPAWDQRDANGNQVPPGTYMLTYKIPLSLSYQLNGGVEKHTVEIGKSGDSQSVFNIE